MVDYEILLDDLESQKAQLELEIGLKLTREDLLEFIKEILQGNENDKDYQKRLIDHLIYKVYVSDELTTAFLNVLDNHKIEKITFEDYKPSKKADNRVQMRLPPSRQNTSGR